MIAVLTSLGYYEKRVNNFKALGTVSTLYVSVKWINIFPIVFCWYLKCSLWEKLIPWGLGIVRPFQTIIFRNIWPISYQRIQVSKKYIFNRKRLKAISCLLVEKVMFNKRLSPTIKNYGDKGKFVDKRYIWHGRMTITYWVKKANWGIRDAHSFQEE